MDDANIPNLLAMPYYEYPYINLEVYKNTREYMLSKANPYYFEGKILKGHLVPLSAIAGGGFVLLCDLLARLLFSPYEISVGIVMAFIGAPFFIFILVKGRGSYDA